MEKRGETLETVIAMNTLPNLPGVNATNPPPLPGVGAVQPTADQKAAMEAHWAALRDAPKSLADLILFVNSHPELLEWAKGSIAGTVKLTPG